MQRGKTATSKKFMREKEGGGRRSVMKKEYQRMKIAGESSG